jgi:hypothetical protein
LGGGGLDHRRRSSTRKVATHLEAKVVSLQLQLLDVAVPQEIEELVELVVIELHGDQFSRPR